MQVYLVRHGETASNAARVVQTPDTPLSERGIEQAKRLADRLAGKRAASILCSTLRRATMTAQPLSSVLKVPITLRADLQERNYGDIRGLPYDELDVSILDRDYEPPGGETWREFHHRVDGVWRHMQKRLLETPPDAGECVVVVTHGLVLHSLVSRLLETSHISEVPVGFDNTSVTTVDAKPPWRVEALNCTVHLET